MPVMNSACTRVVKSCVPCVPLATRRAPLRPIAIRAHLSGPCNFVTAQSQSIVSNPVQLQQPAQRCQTITRASASSAADMDAPDSTWKDIMILGLLFGTWYMANIAFNIVNKQVLKVFAFPLTLTMFQFFMGGMLTIFFWTTGLLKRPTITMETVKNIVPLAVIHTLGNLLTNVSLGAVAVSFTHTIKAMEPFWSVLLSYLFLGTIPSLPAILTLIPIVGGVILASVSEVSFNWAGFLSAMGSSIILMSRNVLSKKLMLKKDGLDNINMFSLITMVSFVLLLPFTIAIEGWRLSPMAFESLAIQEPTGLMQSILITGTLFHLYQQMSYMILSRVTPVTHSIGNCVKRVVIIVASVFVFQHPMSQQNMMGTALALTGVFLYSMATKKKKGAKASE